MVVISDLDIKSFGILGPYFSISSTFTERHSKNQWYRNHIISWRHAFKERLPLRHSCLGMGTYGWHFSQGSTKDICSFWATEFSIFKYPDSDFLLCLATSCPAPAQRQCFYVPNWLLAWIYFSILIFLLPWLLCLHYFDPPLMYVFFSNV